MPLTPTSSRPGTDLRGALVLVVTLVAANPALADTPCGFSTQDWCPAPPGDACGAHRDAGSCRVDAGCTAMPYRGESVVACVYDARGFPRNCPVVGCISVESRGKMRR